MNLADKFVVYDNIQFTKKGWIHRNRILVNGSDSYITVPLKKDSDYLDIKERTLAEDWDIERKKMLNRLSESYKKAPEFGTVFPVLEKIILYEEKNLFLFILNSLRIVRDFLEIDTPFIISSEINIDHKLKSQAKVIALCKSIGATTYVNPIGGVDLYRQEDFRQEGTELKFLKAKEIAYTQFDNSFIPFLSIIDVMMFNKKEIIQHHLKHSYLLS